MYLSYDTVPKNAVILSIPDTVSQILPHPGNHLLRHHHHQCHNYLEDLDPLLDVAEVERILEVPRGVLADLGDLHHLAQLLRVARDQVQERQLVKVLRPLVAHLDNLS